MSDPYSETNLTALVTSVSQLIHHNPLSADLLKRVADEISTRLSGSSVSISLQTRGGSTLSADSGENTRVAEGTPFQLYSRAVELRGAEYGLLRIRLVGLWAVPAPLALALETISHILAIGAEASSLLDVQDELRLERSALEDRLTELKLVARAGGIIARLKGISQSAAERWISEESLRSGRPQQAIADRIVLQHQSVGLRLPALRYRSLRRTA